MAGKRRVAATPNDPHTLVVKGLSSGEVARLDAIVDRRAAALAAQGGTTSRNAVIVAALREFIAREEKA